jgi:ATP-binding cassette, subfamily B, bacterial
VVMFMAYLDRIYLPVHNLTALYAAMQRNVASLLRAFRLLEVPEEGGERKPVEIHDGRVEFHNVEFRYREERPVLKGVSFTLEPGLVTALIGPSGAGKTTIADLLVQLYMPQAGTITVDGHDLAHMDLNRWRRQVCVVSPEGTIFHDTLAQNIRYSRLNATDEEVREAALKAGLGSAIERLPEGITTLLGERGYELSMGERQRVLLARAFLSDPRLLILDEATANLDFKTEAAIKRTLFDLTRGRTTLIIAHRQSMMTDVDRVIAIRDGQVIEEGAPQELFERQGYFFQMMSAQAPSPEVRVQ